MLADEPATTPLPSHFTAIRELGRGSAAVVWLATYEVTGQEVAVKVWHRPLDGDAERARFVNECQWHSVLSDHPNIVGWVWASAPDEANPWIATVPHGESLTKWNRKHGAPNLHRGLELSMDILAGLAEMHRRSLVHRDVNPNNILVDHRGRAALCDLGIAMSLDRTTREYAAGTPGYVAPELTTGDSAPSFTSDVYSAATVISELLGQDVPERLDHLVNSVAKSHRSSDRPRDAGEFRTRLQRAALESGVHLTQPAATQLPSPQHARRSARHRPASLMVGAALLLAGCAVGYHQLTRSTEPAVVSAGQTAGLVASSGGSGTSSSIDSAPAPVLDDGAVLAIFNADNGQCIDVPGFNKGSIDGPIQQHGCHTGTDDNQRWRVRRVADRAAPAGAGNPSDPRYLFQNVTDGLCLDLKGFDAVPSGTGVTQFHCRPEKDNQLFLLTRATFGGLGWSPAGELG